ncbi:MAG: hypothetical protein ACRC28_01085 [Clostridium sp.]|uniref:hypothetical protein n=1 Tax=Clostridium sp. TaxID=1506 RepID=UPI003F34ACC1
MSRAKVIIFIVEGITDKEALEGVISELYEEKNIIFEVIGGDITSEYETKVNNIKSNIGKKIKRVIEKSKIIAKDIDEIIHIVDTDGTYIEEEKVIFGNEFKYFEDRIETKDRDKIIERNERKSKILNIINSMDNITIDRRKIGYSVYYMSSNLEHVLHNKMNVMKSEKNELARNFEDEYIENPEKFLEFVCNSKFSVNLKYKDSWKFIKVDTNSLKRYTNFKICMEKLINK